MCEFFNPKIFFYFLLKNSADQPVTLEEMNLESTRQRWIITYF